MPKQAVEPGREHAVVIGASIGGLAAAAALAPHYRRVTVLDRDTLPDRPAHARAHRIEDVAWKISTGGDLRYEQVQGKLTADMKIMNRYLDRLTAAAQTDPVLARKFLMVAGFMERPESMFAPSIAWRVLRRRRTGPAQPAPAARARVANAAS